METTNEAEPATVAQTSCCGDASNLCEQPSPEATHVIGAKLDMGYYAAVDAVKEALSNRSLGVLTEIDMQAALSQKAGVEIEPTFILGVCNPHLADRALQISPQAGVLLPCSVVVRGPADGPTSVEALDPYVIVSALDLTALEPIARDARALIDAALGDLQGS